MITPAQPLLESAFTHSATGWPREGQCDCGARAVLLSCVVEHADYECRGTPGNYDGYPSDYGPDRCGKVFTVRRD